MSELIEGYRGDEDQKKTNPYVLKPDERAWDTFQRMQEMRTTSRGNKSASARQVGGSHYKDMTVEPWDVVDTWPLEQRIGAYRAGVLKYTMRAGTKGPTVEDYQKAQHYLEKLLEVVE